MNTINGTGVYNTTPSSYAKKTESKTKETSSSSDEVTANNDLVHIDDMDLPEDTYEPSNNPYDNKFSTHQNYFEESYVGDCHGSPTAYKEKLAEEAEEAEEAEKTEDTDETDETDDTDEVSSEEVDELLEATEEQNRQFAMFMSKSLDNQNKNTMLASSTYNGFGSNYTSSFYTSDLKSDVWSLKQGLEDGSITVSQDTIDKAQELTGEGGYYSAEETADRIVDFAKTISGGDITKAPMLRNAVDDAFEDVAEMWGGMENTLQVTQDTYELVMDGFDEWQGIEE